MYVFNGTPTLFASHQLPFEGCLQSSIFWIRTKRLRANIRSQNV